MEEVKDKQVFTISDEQLNELVNKIENNIRKITDKKGEHSLGSKICDSVTDTLTNYLKKKC